MCVQIWGLRSENSTLSRKLDPKWLKSFYPAGSEFISTFEDVANQGTIILNETAEFCRNLGSRQMTRELERTKISDREAGEQVQVSAHFDDIMRLALCVIVAMLL